MNETILIIIFLTIIVLFVFIHSSEVSYQETFTGNHYLVRNLEDKDKAANSLEIMKNNLEKVISHGMTKYDNLNPMKEYIETINNKFKYINFRETMENSKFTSYSINKGEEIVFCLRSKKDNKIHDMNELMYVALHEISHVGCPEIGHTPLFFKINKELLKLGVQCNVYKYKNYNLNPEEYCGIMLNNNILNN